MTGRKKAIAIGAVAITAVIATALLLVLKVQPITVEGAVMRQDGDSRRQLPIANVDITLTEGQAPSAKSDAAGFFRITVPGGIKRGQTVTLHFRHPEYRPLDLAEPAADNLTIVQMEPVSREAEPQTGNLAPVANVTVRYSIRTTSPLSVGSAVRSFQVGNTGNIPCRRQAPCSPDGKWKAAIESTTLDAGEGNEFRNPRVSCIAGPCPFTLVESDRLSKNNRLFHVSVLNWSDTTTFLIEAEVFRPTVTDVVRRLYPVIFGRTLNFTLPLEAEAASMETDLNGAAIVFPLGPSLCLSWADCTMSTAPDRTRRYRCELKPGYRFR